MKTVVKIKFGSHLYGTDTPASDLDYKSVHIPDAEDILLQRVRGSVPVQAKRTKAEGEKNTSEDVDHESYSLQEFLYLLSHGQTVAIDMLFAPEQNIEFKTPLWDYIVANKDKFLTNKSAAFVGYCRTQANKYGIKGSRVAAARDAASFFKQAYDTYGATHKVFEMEPFVAELVHTNLDHMRIVDKTGPRFHGGEERYFECCNKQVPFTASVKLAAEIFTRIHENYGDRARQAEKNEGIDWKALSHAVRVGKEAIELMVDGTVTFPLRDAEYIKDIKLGKIPYKTVARTIEDLLQMVEALSEHSVLRDEPDYEFIDKLVSDFYRDEIVRSSYED